MMKAEPTSTQEQIVAMNEALMIGSLRQHELAEAAEKLNEQLRAEIAERKQAEQRVSLSEIRYRRLFEAAQGGILILDPKTRKIADANPYILDLLGYTHQQINGKELWEIGLLKDKEASRKAFRELQEKGFIRYESLPLETKAGQRREVEFVSNLYNEDGKDEVIQCNIRDVTERKKTEQELSEKARLLDLSNDAIIVRDLDGQITLWNKGAEKLYGWTTEEAIGRHLDSLLKTEFSKPMEQLVAQLESEGQFSGEVVQVARDGRRVPSLCRRVLDRGTKSVLTSYTDITERKRAEEALRASEERFHALFDLGPVGVYSCNTSGTIQEFNRCAVALWGREPVREDANERFCGSFKMHRPEGTAMPHEQCPMADVLSGKISAAHDVEAVIERPDGSRITVIVNIVSLKNDRGKITGAINCFYDITERKRAEEALQEARIRLADHAGQLEALVTERTAELTATNKQLEAFVYSIAHDLRAPLRSMQGFSEMLAEDTDTVLSEVGRDFANRINKSAQFMDALLQDLLAFSRIAQQRIELTSVNLETVIRSTLSRLEEEIQKENVRVEIVGPWPSVLVYEPMLGQVIFNLVSNALKFARPDAPPQIRLYAEERMDGLLDKWIDGPSSTNPSIHQSINPPPSGIHPPTYPPIPLPPAACVRVWVEDNGIGIAPDHQAQIFRLFTRLHGDKFPGTGIGLAIVQKGIERMGGNVGLESTPGQGSRFWFELRKG